MKIKIEIGGRVKNVLNVLLIVELERGCPNIIYNYWGNNATTRFDNLLFQLQQEISEYDLMMKVCEFAHGQ